MGKMTDLEFDVLDELYFVIAFEDLHNTLLIDEQELKEVLYAMIKKGWVKCMQSFTEEATPLREDFIHNYRNYQYLATKAGLLAHNSKD